MDLSDSQGVKWARCRRERHQESEQNTWKDGGKRVCGGVGSRPAESEGLQRPHMSKELMPHSRGAPGLEAAAVQRGLETIASLRPMTWSPFGVPTKPPRPW